MRIRYPLFCACVLLFYSAVPNAFAGPPFRTDDPQPVDYRHWEFYIASEQQFEKDATTATLPHFEINYGVVPDVQIHFVAPLGYTRTSAGTHYGYSDTEIGIKYRFTEETDDIPQIGVFPLVEIPTGDVNMQLGAGKTQVYFPVWIRKVLETGQRTAEPDSGMFACPDSKIGFSADGSCNMIFQNSSLLAESCITRLRIRRMQKPANRSAWADL